MIEYVIIGFLFVLNVIVSYMVYHNKKNEDKKEITKWKHDGYKYSYMIKFNDYTYNEYFNDEKEMVENIKYVVYLQQHYYANSKNMKSDKLN